MTHYFIVSIFILLISILFYQIIIVDDKKTKERLDKKILNGEIKYIWLNGLMARIEGLITEHILTISLIGPEGDSPTFYCNLKDIKKEVLSKDLISCGIQESIQHDEKQIS